MHQKLNLIRFKLFASALIVLSATTSCDKGENEFKVRAKWIYINETDHKITFSPTENLSQFDISPNDTITYNQEGEGPKTVNPDNFFPPLNASTVVFDDVKCNTALTGKLNNITSYESKKLQHRYYGFTYRFTEEDYDKAEDCN